MSNKHITEDLRHVDPVKQVNSLYTDKIHHLVEVKNRLISEGKDTTCIQNQLNGLAEVITALGKVRDLQHYQQNYNDLTMAERRKIAEHSKKVF